MELKKHLTLDKEKLLDDFEELTELVELHPRNNYNLCLSGGMQTLIEIVKVNPDAEIRRHACSIMTAALSNNKDSQNFAKRLGCLTLMNQYVEETNVKNKEALMGVISSFLRGENIESKRDFLKDFQGLQFMIKAICNEQN